MNVKTMMIAAALVVSGAAFAGPQGQPAQGGQQQQGWGGGMGQMGGMGPMADSPEARQRQETRRRLMQVVGLTEVLGLSTQDALKVDEIIRRFDDRRRPLRDQVRESSKVVRDAARGDNAALGNLDAAITRVLDARIQLATLDKEMFQTLAQGFNPQQRAKLAIFYARMHRFAAGMKAHGMDGEGNEGRRFRMMMRRPGMQGELEGAPSPDMGAMADGAPTEPDLEF